jgi:hypothetical protein
VDTLILRISESVFDFNSVRTIHFCTVKASIYNVIPARQSSVRLFSLGGARFSLVNVVALFISSLHIMHVKRRETVSHDGTQQDAGRRIRTKNDLSMCLDHLGRVSDQLVL